MVPHQPASSQPAQRETLCSSLTDFSWQPGMLPASQLSAEATLCSQPAGSHLHCPCNGFSLAKDQEGLEHLTSVTSPTPAALWQSRMLPSVTWKGKAKRKENVGKWCPTFPLQLSHNPNRQGLCKWHFPSHSTWPWFNSASTGHWRGRLEHWVGERFSWCPAGSVLANILNSSEHLITYWEVASRQKACLWGPNLSFAASWPLFCCWDNIVVKSVGGVVHLG